MTAKRFTYEYDEYNGNLFDNKMNTFYHIEDSDENIEVLCDRLNWLVEENEQLKKDREELFIRERDTKNRWRELKQENEQLKQENKELKEELLEVIDASSDNRPNKKGFMGNGRFA